MDLFYPIFCSRTSVKAFIVSLVKPVHPFTAISRQYLHLFAFIPSLSIKFYCTIALSSTIISSFSIFITFHPSPDLRERWKPLLFSPLRILHLSAKSSSHPLTSPTFLLLLFTIASAHFSCIPPFLLPTHTHASRNPRLSGQREEGKMRRLREFAFKGVFVGR